MARGLFCFCVWLFIDVCLIYIATDNYGEFYTVRSENGVDFRFDLSSFDWFGKKKGVYCEINGRADKSFLVGANLILSCVLVALNLFTPSTTSQNEKHK